MSDYISRKDASLCVNSVIEGDESEEVLQALAAVLVAINHVPAAEVQPVPEGKWVSVVVGTHVEFECTLCGSRMRGNGTEPFCPHCGKRLKSCVKR